MANHIVTPSKEKLDSRIRILADQIDDALKS